MVNKKGIARIIELLIAITLVSAILIIIYKQNIPNQELPDFSERARDILSEIGAREDLREEIVIKQTDVGGMVNTLLFINNSLPDYILFELRACTVNSACGQSSYVGNVFSAERIISASNSDFGPIKLRLFLWVNEPS